MTYKFRCKECGCFIDFTLDKQNQKYWYHETNDVFSHLAIKGC